MMSTCHGQERNEKGKPLVVEDYNKSMLFVDTSNQMAAYYPFVVRICKWSNVKSGKAIPFRHLFSAVVETVFQKLPWEDKGITINGSKLSNLRYADDLVIIANSARELQEMMTSLAAESAAVGLTMNKSKTLVMTNRRPSPIFVDSQQLTYSNEFVYLGQRISFDRNISLELNRRIRSGWASFNRFRQLLTNRRIPFHL